MGDDNTPMWKLSGHRESPMDFWGTLRDELNTSWSQMQLLFQDYGPTSERGLTSREIVRRVRFELIEVPDPEDARTELRRRKNKAAAEKRKRTIARKKQEAKEALAKVIPLLRGG